MPSRFLRFSRISAGISTAGISGQFWREEFRDTHDPFIKKTDMIPYVAGGRIVGVPKTRVAEAAAKKARRQAHANFMPGDSMNIQDLGSLGEFIAAIATIATLVYLAVQIRQNTQATRDQTTRSFMLANSEATATVAADGDLADVLLRGVYNRKTLNAIEKLRFNCFWFSYYNQVDYAYEQYLAGKLEAQSWEKIAKEIPVYISSPGIREWWLEDKIRFSKAFVEYVDAELEKHGPPSKLPTVPSEDELTNAT